MIRPARAAVVVAVVVVVVTAGACAKGGAAEQLTVIVEADRTRALADQARLAQMQESLASATQELVDTRKDLTTLRERLLQTGALTGEEMRRLQEREARLIARESSPIAPPPTHGGLSRSDVEELLRAQEARLRASLTAVPATSSTSAPLGIGVSDEGGSREAVVTQLAALSALRSQRGLRDDDVEGGPALQRRIDDALRALRPRAALEAVAELRSQTEATVVNGAFVKKKYARASARLEMLAPESKDRAKRLLGDANTKNAKGDAAGANEALNAVLALR